MRVPGAPDSDRRRGRDIREAPKTKPQMEYGKGESLHAIDQNRCC
jgi:hypothetical protein